MLLTPRSTPPPTLPSLLRYVDHDLMQSIAIHNRPPHPTAKCPFCQAHWNESFTLPTSALATSSLPTLSTFLPLTSCNHWIHYRCLIAHACDLSNPGKDKCPICNVQLYHWDGVTALTLATRTNLTLIDTNPHGSFTPANPPGPTRFLPSDTAEYISECSLIDSLIHQAFFTHLSIQSKYEDGSPDLRGLPKARWLSWSTRTGCLLFGTLVVIKMRRFLVEGQAGIMRTEAWRVFENGGRELQRRIMEEVHGPKE
ncbi:hypothetical protein T440DRAFT_460584 [Plenodomus tracheiphilus IPT5]|uniref:RING-type domain-containing protein n=1 Tax=Plenodomus tracheiphilus IPT5 TaxID=1408161 RepID=A0A6A7ASG9_9PLEO|nr:hypothetical protein T440DRAFT_460584 [Plenodomus tracheiphilus IPT5]